MQSTCVNNRRKSSIRQKTTIDEIQVQPANSLPQRLSAYELAYEEYIKLNYVELNHKKMIVTKYDLCPKTMTFNAYLNSENVGTMTVIGGQHLPLHQSFEEINHQYPSHKICEISRLAIKEKHKRNINILLGLINFSWLYAHFILKATHWYIEVNPKHAGFYKKLLDFEIVGTSDKCELAQNAPAVLMRLRLSNIDLFPDKYKFFSRDEERRNHLNTINSSSTNQSTWDQINSIIDEINTIKELEIDLSWGQDQA